MIFAWLSSSQLLLAVEDCTNKGCIDMSVETKGIIYLTAFTVDMPEETAPAQIKARGYAEKYRAKGKKVILIGTGFSSEKRTVTEFAIDACMNLKND